MNALSNASLTSPDANQAVTLLDSVVDRYRSRLFRLAYRITGNHEDAEDVVQETLFRITTKAHQFRGRSQFTTWLTRIAINQALTCLRKQRRGRFVSLDEYLADDNDRTQYQIRDSRPDPEATVLSGESKALLDLGIARLPKRHHEIINLYHGGECSISEIREALDLTDSTVKSRLIRARRLLREQVRDIGRTGR